jgi:hypothetical protein
MIRGGTRRFHQEEPDDERGDNGGDDGDSASRALSCERPAPNDPTSSATRRSSLDHVTATSPAEGCSLSSRALEAMNPGGSVKGLDGRPMIEPRSGRAPRPAG